MAFGKEKPISGMEFQKKNRLPNSAVWFNILIFVNFKKMRIFPDIYRYE